MNMRIAAVLAPLVLAAAPAQAVITSITLSGGATVAVGTPVNLSATTAGITAFNEVQNIVLPAGAPNTRPVVNPVPGFGTGIALPAGQTVSSHFFVFRGTGAGQTSFAGTITFNQKIVGIQRATGNVNAARSAMLRVGGIDYVTGFNGLETSGVGLDTLTLVNTNTLDFSFNSTTGGDMFSVITTVPEASTWAMMLAGFGLVGLGARRRRMAVAA